MSKPFKKILALCLATLMLLTSCVAHNITPPEFSDTAPGTQATAESAEGTTPETEREVLPTEAPSEPGSEAPGTEAPSESPTDIISTEAPTEAETDPPKPSVSARGDCGYTFWSDSGKTVGRARLDSIKHQVSQKEYAKEVNGGKLMVNEDSGVFEIIGWVGFSFENFELAWRIGVDNEVEYCTENVAVVKREAAVLQAAKKEGQTNATGFAYTFNINNFVSGQELHLLIKDKDTDTIYCFNELAVTVKNSPVDGQGAALEKKYGLGYGSDMDMSAYDPIQNHEPITAPDDDASLKLWFDHITEKVTRYDTSGKDYGASSYTIQMGKNEMEGCQFFLYSPTTKKVLLKISDFENDKGETLSTELGVEYYIEDGYITHHGYPAALVYPDAVIPYDSYISYCNGTEHGSYGMDANSKVDFGNYILLGPFSGSNWDHEKYPFRDSIRGFVVQAETTKDTTPGAYKATVEVYDAETGKCIKMANVYTYVYDVTLSDETALDTAFNLWDNVGIYMHHYNENPDLTRYTDVEITKATAEFFLKNRITPSGSLTFFNVMGAEWFENPRVTTVRVLNKEHYDSMKVNPVLAKKMFYYGQDEPGVARGWRPITWPDGTNETIYDNTGLLSILAVAREADMLRDVWGWEDYRLMVPFERTLDFTRFNFNSVDKTTAFPAWYDQYAVNGERDSMEYLAKRVNMWTTVFTGATPRDLASVVSGTQYMQTSQQEKTLGALQNRLDQFQAEGDELWNYVACQPPYTAPYQNILLFNDGTEARTMFWTTYMLGGTGFLYWHVSYYDATGNTTYTMRNPFSKTGPGDGILIYPGSAYNQLDPIPSIRLLNIRDGIEDYQLLTMLEETQGEEFTDELVSHIVTSTVTFTKNDDVVYNVRSFLLRALEEAGK
ncbi:MAG: DUF4091 domain-containing protein [Ruminococcaceae bacterium]|nr:DUF4091 domain-containing protein [Oscillospiraceae bacterium]